jgi:hypothetical protein
MKALVELPAKDALSVCRHDLLGKDHAAVSAYLGTSDLNHGDGEYVYHPVRADGSMWILLVEFDDTGVAFDIYADELSAADTPRPNQALLPTSMAVTPAADAPVAPTIAAADL